MSEFEKKKHDLFVKMLYNFYEEIGDDWYFLRELKEEGFTKEEVIELGEEIGADKFKPEDLSDLFDDDPYGPYPFDIDPQYRRMY